MEVPARGQCIAISEWAKAVKIFVIHVNAHQRVTSAEGRVGWKPQGSGSKNQVDGVTHSVAGSRLLSSISPVIAYQAHKQSGNCGRDGDYAWAQLLLTNTDLAMTIAECPNCRQQRPTLRSRCDSGEIRELLGDKLITLDCFHHGKASTLFLFNSHLI